MTTITLAKIGTHQTVAYAVDELARYLKKIDKHLLIDQRTYEAYDESITDVIWVGLTSLVEYQKEDDEIKIDVKDGAGVITAANERAVLIAAYRFLHKLGCRWIRPGDDGEIIPEKSFEKVDISVQMSHMPSARYRVVSIEGAISYEHTFNMINWLLKVGFNTYYMQFKTPYLFWQGWYNHSYNPSLEFEPMTNEESFFMKARVDEELVKRSIGYFALGHGYTIYPFGVPDLSITDPDSPLLTDEIKSHYALIDGERKMQRNLNFTQLCYSRPEVRKKIADWVAQYYKDHPEVTMLRLALADGYNNWCECDDCKKLMPADWMIAVLNNIDAKLTEEGIDKKMGFSLYMETLWPPKQNKLNNPSRFMMTLCPSNRTFKKALCELDSDPDEREVMPFTYNNIEMPHETEDVIAHFNAWKRAVPGTEYFFTDYSLMWEHFFDLGYNHTSRVIHKDAANLDKFGFAGMMDFTSQRAAFPTALPLYSMAAGLWDKNSKFEDIAEEYYTAAFGEDAKIVWEYLDKLEALFDSAFLRYENPAAYETVPERTKAIHDLVATFREKYLEPNKEKNASWKYLCYHADYCDIYADVVYAYICESEDKAQAMADKMNAFCQQTEPELHTVFDPNVFFPHLMRRMPRLAAKNPKGDVNV